MDKKRRKEIVAEYKLKRPTGGVYRLYNSVNGKSLIKGEVNLEAFQNRIRFSMQMNSCPMLKLTEDWKRYGKEAFHLEILEATEAGELESTKAFQDRLRKMEEVWKERFEQEGLY